MKNREFSMANLNDTEGGGIQPTIETVLAEHSFTLGLKPEHLQALIGNAMRMRFAPGEMIFHQGDPANRFYLIENGKVAIESGRVGIRGARIQTIGAGEVLGWSWLFPPYAWHFDARALEETFVIFFYGSRLREQCEEDHDLGYELMKRMAAVMSRRLQITRAQLLTAIG